jgi:hypothetical protein
MDDKLKQADKIIDDQRSNNPKHYAMTQIKVLNGMAK